MTIRSWTYKLFNRPGARKVRKALRGFRPAIEALENRRMLAVLIPTTFSDCGKLILTSNAALPSGGSLTVGAGASSIFGASQAAAQAITLRGRDGARRREL